MPQKNEPSRILIYLSSAAGIFQAGSAYAAGYKESISFGSTLAEYITRFYNWSIGLGLTLGFLMLIWAGYTMVTSAGDTQKVGKAKEIIIGSITGLFLLVGARLILNMLSVPVK